MYRARVEVESTKGLARVLSGALAPEVGEDLPRTSSRLEETDEGIVLHLEAEDLSSLRAALNSYLRWAHIGIETVNEIDGGK